jgi:hypothetical protein
MYFNSLHFWITCFWYNNKTMKSESHVSLENIICQLLRFFTNIDFVYHRVGIFFYFCKKAVSNYQGVDDYIITCS